MSSTFFDKLYLESHRKCQEHFELKTKHLGKTVFPHGKPTLFDLYRDPDSFYITTIPEDLQLDYYFENYSEIVIQSSRTAMASPAQDMKVTRAIWHYGIDKQHTYSSFHRNTRFNIIVMAFVLGIQMANPHHHLLQGISKEGLEFARTFFWSWWSSLTAKSPQVRIDNLEEFLKEWKTGHFDLVFFPYVLEGKMKKALKELDRFNLPHDLAIKAEEFLETGGVLTEEQLRQYGPVLAYRWYLRQEEISREEAKEQAAKEAMASLDNLGAALDFSEDHLLEILRKVKWGHAVIKALMTDIITLDDPVPISRAEGSERWWMSPARAVEIMQDEVGEVADLLNNLNL